MQKINGSEEVSESEVNKKEIIKMNRSNMYQLSAQQWSPFKGCKFACKYCKKSFQAQAKRQKHNCGKCYTYTPHEHPERLGEGLAKTGYMQFIFSCSSGDISFASTEYLNRIVKRIDNEPATTFLIQSKNPKTFARVKFPANVILGTTLETNQDDLYKAEGIAKAPAPSQRFKDFLKIDHPQKMVTIEPVMQFDLKEMVSWIEQLKPLMVWLGFDSKKSDLPEPELEKVKELYWELGRRGFVVVLKTIREAHVCKG
jgi:DNA repair photolyase